MGLAVVNGAATHHYSATEVRQVGAEMCEPMQQKIPAEYAVKTAEHAIKKSYSATDTVNTLNTFATLPGRW